jgi:hypothetical protein
MQRQIIIASDPEDFRYRNKVMKWGSSGQLGERIGVVALDDPRFYRPDRTLDQERLAWSLKQSPLVIVLVGEYNFEHPWLAWEGEFCHQWGIKRAIVRIPYSQGELPQAFSVLREIAYNPNAIEKEVKEKTSNHLNYF